MITVPASILAALAVLVLPGLPVSLRVRMHPLARAAVLPALSIAVVSVSAELGHLLGIPWTPLSPLVLGLLLGLPLLLRRRGAEDPTPPRTTRIGRTAVLVGLTLGAATLLVRGLRMTGGIDVVSQTYDAVFHLNAVRWILETGDASAMSVGSMTALPGEGTFYPAAWHQLASLVAQSNGGDVVIATTVLLLTSVAVIWPLGMMAIVRLCTGAGPLGVLLAGSLSGVAGAFPLMLMSWGLVLPNLLSTLLLPAFVLLGAQVLGLIPSPEERIGRKDLAVLLPPVMLAIVLSHPQGAFAALVLAIPTAASALLVHRRGPGADRLIAALVLGVSILAALVAWPALSPPQSSAVWLPTTGQLGAFWQGLTLAGNTVPGVLVLGLAMAAAALGLALRGGGRWLLAAFAVSSAVFVVAASVWDPEIRYAITGPWYTDPFRVAAIPVVVGIPLLAAGLSTLADLFRDPLRDRLPALPARAALAGALCVLLLLTAVLSPSARVAETSASGEWQIRDLLSEDEQELLEMVPEHVPEGSVIAVNPWNGGALAYAVSDRPVLSRFMGFEAPEEVHLLNASLDEAQEDPAVCTAAHELGVDYALDFGPQELFDRRSTYTGLNEISTSGAAEVVAQVGDARLLRLEPCRGEDGSMLT